MDFDHEVLYLFLFQRVNQENRMSILENSVGEGNSFFEWIGEGNSMIHKDNSSDYNNSKDGSPKISIFSYREDFFCNMKGMSATVCCVGFALI